MKLKKIVLIVIVTMSVSVSAFDDIPWEAQCEILKRGANIQKELIRIEKGDSDSEYIKFKNFTKQ